MISFFGSSGKTLGMDSDKMQPFQALRGYWEALRKGNALPCRADIDPRGMSSFLENVFLIERIAKGHGRFRLAGMAFHDIMDMDVRGMPISALFDAGSRPRLAEALEGMWASPAALDIWLEAERGIGRPMLAARMQILPLAQTGSELPLAIGCLISDGVIGRAPRRFAISGVTREVLRAAPAIAPFVRPEPPRAAPHLAPVLALAESAGEFTPGIPLPKSAGPGPAAKAEQPRIRLVYSRD